MNMKALFPVMLLIFLIFASSGHAQWHVIPTGINDDIRGISFCADNIGYGVTSRGTILRFTGLGQPWKIDTLAKNMLLEDVFFFKGGRKGFAFGSTGSFFATEDGGLKWTPYTFDTSLWLCDIAFLDSKHGFLVGYDIHDPQNKGTLFYTSNSGKKWDTLSVSGRQLQTIDISPEGVITVSGADKIFISRDKGKTWETPKLPSWLTIKTTAIRGNQGIIIGMGGALALSDDAGKTWKKWNALTENIHLFSLLMLSPMIAYAVGSDGYILYTDDAGRNWTPQASGTAFQLLDIQLIGNRIFACGSGGAMVFRNLQE
jgi:photosystem II stability/assembly factor-like uncharacterized protein